LSKEIEALMGTGLPIQSQAMSIKSPSQTGLPLKRGWIGNFSKIETLLIEFRISLPHALITAKVGQTRIDTHACTCTNDQAIRPFKQVFYMLSLLRIELKRHVNACCYDDEMDYLVLSGLGK